MGGSGAAEYVEVILSSTLSGMSLPPPAQEGLFVWALRGEENVQEQRTRNAFGRPKALCPLTLQS